MSDRVRDILTVLAIVVVLLGILGGLWFLRGGGTPTAGVAAAPGAGASTRPDVLPKPGPEAAAGQTPASTPSGAVPPGGGRTAPAVPADATAAPTAPESDAATAPPAWRKRAPADFTEEDLAQCGRGVTLDLGSYEVVAGQEFTVTLGLSGPALESLTLMLRFGGEFLRLVPDSAVPVGSQFRSGIECYAGRDGGTLVLIHSGVPGKKNLDAGTGSAAVQWRMRALRAGTTRFEVLPQTSFANAHGDTESYGVSGGDVTVR